MKTIRVLLADDHAIIRAGLRSLLEAAGDMRVVGEAKNGEQAVRKAKRLRPDVVLLDLAMPLMNGVEAARQITRGERAPRVLILSTYSDAQHVRQAVAAGATGYLMKETTSDVCLRAIRETSKGNAFFSPPIARVISKQRRNFDRPGKPTVVSGLSKRQAQVLQLIAEGNSNPQIAGRLSLSPKTVEKHRQSLMNKLDIHNIATLTRYAVSHGVVGSERTDWAAAPAPAYPPVMEKLGRHPDFIEPANAVEAETLLVVDDDEMIRAMEVEVLRELGCRVLEADGPVEAMRLATMVPAIHLLVTDFCMPEANGLELTRQFRKLHPEAPVLMISGSLEAICGQAEYPDRFEALAKPFTREQLLDRVCSLLSPPTTRLAVAVPLRVANDKAA